MVIVSPLSCKLPLQPRYDDITRCRSNFAMTTLHIGNFVCVSHGKDFFVLSLVKRNKKRVRKYDLKRFLQGIATHYSGPITNPFK